MNAPCEQCAKRGRRLVIALAVIAAAAVAFVMLPVRGRP
jgi:hypothetical protein